MKVIQNKKLTEISKTELLEKIKDYKQIIIDLGTGDGKYIYKEAMNNATNYYIGIDPAKKQFDETISKINRNKLKNIILCIGSIEQLPSELYGLANQVIINLPWGSLLEKIVKPDTKALNDIRLLLNNNGVLQITFGYSPELEPTETERLSLGTIDENYIKTNLLPVYEQSGFKLELLKILNSTELNEISSSWAKRLQQRDKREVFRIVFSVKL